MSKISKSRSASFKFKVVLDSFVKGNVSEVARVYAINANQLSMWRKQFTDKGDMVFQSDKVFAEKRLEKKIEQMENLIGRKEVEIAVLKKYLDFMHPKMVPSGVCQDSSFKQDSWHKSSL